MTDETLRTPRDVLLAAFREEDTSLHVIVPSLAVDVALDALSAAGFEVLPRALVDAVLDSVPDMVQRVIVSPALAAMENAADGETS